MNVLSIDTSGLSISVAVQVDFPSLGIFSSCVMAGRRHSELLLSIIDTTLKQAGVAPADLDLLACTAGPGSFTGIRLAFSTLKALSVAHDIPAISIPTPDCMAEPFSAHQGLVIPLIDARRNHFYGALYRNGDRVSDYFDASLSEIQELAQSTLPQSAQPPLFIRDTPDSFLIPHLALPLLHIISKHAIMENGIVKKCADFHFSPLYVRKSDAEERDEAK